MLTVDGVDMALDHGANTVQIDAVAWDEGRWADHGGTPTSYGSSMAAMSDRIAQQRRAGPSPRSIAPDRTGTGRLMTQP
ncbi:hypothetical protein [Streptomyces sp. OE57]|uniref:hypothetical protein n=1 Tax=Streptomyces lacaronensis TaxID=3379885 RepID=UPI0039B72CAA